MITGGARSDKSECAEQLALEKGGNSALYIATSDPFYFLDIFSFTI